MSKIKINIGGVRSGSSGLNLNYNKLTNIKQGINSLRYSIDGKIASRRNISSRLNSAYDSVNALEKKIKGLEKFIDESMDRYEKAENNVQKQGEAIEMLLSLGIGVGFDLSSNIGGSNSLYNSATIGVGDPNAEDIGEEIEEAKLGQKKAYGFSGITGIANLSSDKFLFTDGGLNMKMFKEGKNIFIKIIDGEVLNNKDFLEYRSTLTDGLGGTCKWDKSFVSDLVNKGVPLYNKDSKKFFNNNTNKFLGTDMESLDKYIGNIGKSKVSVLSNTFKDTFSENFNITKNFKGLKDIKGASKLTKIGKIAGPVGIVLTAADDINEEFNSNRPNDKRGTGEKIADVTADVGIDLATGSAAMATGAALGSLIVPPVGTVVGAGVGLGLNVAANFKFIGKPPKSLVDAAKDKAKEEVSNVASKLNEAAQIGKKIGLRFW